jgi:hypothetical protein
MRGSSLLQAGADTAGEADAGKAHVLEHRERALILEPPARPGVSSATTRMFSNQDGETSFAPAAALAATDPAVFVPIGKSTITVPPASRGKAAASNSNAMPTSQIPAIQASSFRAKR